MIKNRIDRKQRVLHARLRKKSSKIFVFIIRTCSTRACIIGGCL